MAWITAALFVGSAMVALPCFVLFIQCAVGAWPFKARQTLPVARAPLGVLVPAHDEEQVIRATLESIQAQLSADDRLLVIADNCSDATARIARECGADVFERNDLERRGKGYALQSGVDVLRTNPPELVVIIDADCRLMSGCLDALAAQVAQKGRPVQACYLMTPAPAPRAVDVISSLAVLVKNRVRPLAMARLGLPCLITGSGSAFPWKAIASRSFAGGNIVEDMQFAIDLALAGFPPSFCDMAVIEAALPACQSGFISQRRRWEHGHLQTLLFEAPRLLSSFLKSGRVEIAAMMVDLAVPPLSLLAATNGLALAVTILWAFFHGGGGPAAVAGGSVLLLLGSVLIAWWRFARDGVPFRSLLAVPVYVLVKLPLYATFLFRRERTWVRTTRGSSAGGIVD
jgi:glycosyltransferase involved in cell wall biosynthesis